MGQTILTNDQKKVLDAIRVDTRLVDNFYLSGGTALAEYYLQHRYSDDLDFFTGDEIDTLVLHEFTTRLKISLDATDLSYGHIHDRHLFSYTFPYGNLKIEFTRYPFIQLETPEKKEYVRVDSFTDIGANKIMALLDRFDPKDFVDLYYILQRTDLKTLVKNAEKKFGITIDSLFVGAEIAKIQRVHALPRMIEQLSLGDLKKFWIGQAKNIGKEILT